MEPSGETAPNDSGQQGPIMGPQPEKMQKNNTAKYFGRSKFSAVQNSSAPSMTVQTAPAQTAPIISSNPNTPQFFNEAMAANANNGERSRFRIDKKVIIGAAIALVAIIVVIIVATTSGFTVESKEEVAKKYASYASYVLWGKDTAFLTGEYDKKIPYSIVTNTTRENKTEYYTEVIKKSEVFRNDISGVLMDSETKNNLVDYASAMGAWSRLVLLEDDMGELKNMYLETGKNKTIKTVEEKYSFLTKSSNDSIKSSGQKLIEANKIQISVLVELSSYNCELLSLSDECLELSEELLKKDDAEKKTNDLIDEASSMIGEEFLKAIQNTYIYYERLAD